MAIYWVMFVVAALAALWPQKLPRRQATWARGLVCLGFAFVIGFRDRVGGDWYPYERAFFEVSNYPLGEVLGLNDPAYYFSGWLVANLGGDFATFNFIAALLALAALMRFASRQPLPWVALAVAIPYLVIVVFMGYSRQAIAISLAIFGLMAFENGKVRAFVGWIILATLFHKSAVLLFPVAALSASKNRWLSLGLIVGTGALVYYLFVSESSEHLIATYIDVARQSEGGATRVLMNALPASLFLLLRQRFDLPLAQARLWTWMSLFALGCLPVLALSSTAADRISLYFIPIQLFVFARLPNIGWSKVTRGLLLLGVLLLYFSVQFTWLTYSSHAQYWIPYHFSLTHG
jgi:hypothetical protein